MWNIVVSSQKRIHKMQYLFKSKFLIIGGCVVISNLINEESQINLY